MSAERKHVVAAFGELDDATVARVLETGVSQDQLFEARDRIGADDAPVSEPSKPSAVVAEVMRIIEMVDEEDDER